MSACTPPAPSAFETGTARGVTPPLLPTLMMAVILGTASYLCQEPAAVAPPMSVPATAVAAAPEAAAEAPYIPASLAFRTQFPLVVVAQAEPALAIAAHKAASRTAARLAAPHRAEAPRVAAKAPPAADKPLPFAAEADSAVVASDDEILPEIALPFAPTIRAVTRAGAVAGALVGAGGAALGAETASLGTAVSGWVERLR